MRKLRLLIFMSILACCILTLAACGGPALMRPSGLTVDEGVNMLSWSNVSGASGYKVQISNESGTSEVEVQRSYYSISGLSANQEYTFKVQALGDRLNYSDSEWSEPYVVYKEYENGLNFRAINSQSEYELTGLGTAPVDFDIPTSFRGKKVTKIANSAFFNSSKITSVTFQENSITSIGDKSFQNCSNLESITIPEGVTSIGKAAFRNCTKLTSITLPDSLTTLEENAFADCSALTEIKFGSGLRTIGKGAFRKCTSLTKIEIPGNIYDIGEIAFSDCTSLTEVTLGDGVTVIRNDAFSKCTALEKVDLGNTLAAIYDNAFYQCISLKSIDIPDSVVGMGASVFNGCEALENVTIGSGLTTVGQKSFYKTAIWNNAVAAGEKVVYVDKWLVSCLDFTATELTIRNDIVGIGFGAFYNSAGSELATIKYEGMPSGVTSGLPNSLKIIDANAFANCSSLYSLQMGKNVERIGKYAFLNCSILARVDFSINNSLTTIDDFAFAGTNLGYPGRDNAPPLPFKFPNSLQVIGQSAFANSYYSNYYSNRGGIVYVGGWVVECKNEEILSGSILPSIADTTQPADENGNYPTIDTVGIANYAFFNCQAMESVFIPDTIQHIGRAAFLLCAGLKSVTIPQGIDNIDEYTFYYCASLTNISIPDSVKSIGRSAFYCNLSLEQIVIPNNVEVIDDYAFYGCFSLADISFGLENEVGESQLTIIGKSAFYANESLANFVIPDSVTTIGSYAFYDCISLITVKIGKNVESIGTYAFSFCVWLKEVTIPGNVQSIGDYAFRKCSDLETVIIEEGVQSIGVSAFSSCTKLIRVSIPSSIEYIGSQAFRDCWALKSAVIYEGAQGIGMHVFYGCTDMTIYTNLTAVPADWSLRFNTSYCPIVFGCELSEDNYVVSLVKTEETIANLYSKNAISSPERVGYTFKGWSLTQNGSVAFAADELNSVENGTTLYAVWSAQE